MPPFPIPEDGRRVVMGRPDGGFANVDGMCDHVIVGHCCGEFEIAICYRPVRVGKGDQRITYLIRKLQVPHV